MDVTRVRIQTRESIYRATMEISGLIHWDMSLIAGQGRIYKDLLIISILFTKYIHPYKSSDTSARSRSHTVGIFFFAFNSST